MNDEIPGEGTVVARLDMDAIAEWTEIAAALGGELTTDAGITGDGDGVIVLPNDVSIHPWHTVLIIDPSPLLDEMYLPAEGER